MSEKRVYTFGNGQAEGKADMRNLLGGKGANLAEMNLIGVPVPPGFTITTDVCNEYYAVGKEKVVELLKSEVENAVKLIESLMKSKFGDVENPLLVSVRSGARASMPGMMDTILNLGLNDEVVEGLTRKTGNARFAWDSYRRFVQMYGDVVLGMKPTNKEDIDPFEAIIEEVKAAKGVKLDNELEVDDLKQLPMNRLSYDQKYVLSVSYVNLESLSLEQKQNILDKLPVNGDEKLMEYWIYIGRLQPVEAENIAMQKSDDELLLYAYMLDKDLTEADENLNGEEKAQKLEDLESKISHLAEVYMKEE